MSRKAGSVPEETRANLISAAIAEFHAYGYEKASLRRICAKAEVTTGAIYFFFQDKEDLFAQVIMPVTNGILKLLTEHFEWERKRMPEEPTGGLEEDIQAAAGILEAYYAHKELFEIVLNNRERPVIIEFFDTLTELLERQTRCFLESDFALGNGIMDGCMIHWFSHLQVDAVLHILSHDYPEEEAKKQLAIMVKFLRGGFLSVLM